MFFKLSRNYLTFPSRAQNAIVAKLVFTTTLFARNAIAILLEFSRPLPDVDQSNNKVRWWFG